MLVRRGLFSLISLSSRRRIERVPAWQWLLSGRERSLLLLNLSLALLRWPLKLVLSLRMKLLDFVRRIRRIRFGILSCFADLRHCRLLWVLSAV